MNQEKPDKAYCVNCRHSVQCFDAHVWCGKVDIPEKINPYNGRVEQEEKNFNDKINKYGTCPHYEPQITYSIFKRIFG